MLIVVLLLSLVLLLISISRNTRQSHGDVDRLSMMSRISAVFLRFPFVVAASVLGTTAGFMLIGNPDTPSTWKKLLATALLTLPLLISSRLLAEKKGQEDFRPDKLTILIAAMGCAYFFLLGDSPSYGTWYRHALWTIATFLSILLSPFYRRSEEEEYWHFTASMVYAFAIAFTWAFALFAGISAALAGINYLLTVNVTGETFLRLWVVMAGFVAVVIFLSALPADIQRILPRNGQSKIFEGFIRYVLIPLVALYLVILYVYAGKIIIQGSWPKGGVAGFILGFSGVGIVTYLLGYGVIATTKSFQSLFRRFFFPLVLPLTPMLFLSVWRRVSEYGVTETRYFGILSSLWLAAVSLYYIFSRRKDLRVVPASLCLVVILVSFGPWGALSTSARSQTSRLQKQLQEAGILVNGTLQPVSKIGKPGALAEINRTVVYLHKIGNIAPLTVWSGGKIASADKPETIAAKMGIPFSLQGDSSESYFGFSTKQEEGTDVSGYMYLWRIETYRHNDKEISYTIGNTTILTIKPGDGLQRLRITGVKGQQDAIDVSMFAEALLKEYPAISNHEFLPWEKMVIDLPRTRTRVALSEINGTITDGKPVVNYIKGVVIWRGK